MVPQIDPCMKNAILCVDSPSLRLCATITHRESAIFFARFHLRRNKYHSSQIGEQDEILLKKLHISYIDQLWCRQYSNT